MIPWSSRGMNPVGSTVFTALDQPPVNLTADGSRAFFTSRDALAPGAVEGQTNVYEWNRGVTRLVYSGRSDFDASSGPATELFGVSASGDDVFIRTTASLDPRDDDGAYDLYDFRVDGGLPRPAEPPESCAPLAGACQGAGETASPQRLDTTQPGAGNGPLSERASLRLARLTKAQRTALAAGRKAGIVVAVNRSGTITIRGIASVNGIRGTVISASRRTAGAARVAVPVSLSKPARQRLARTGRMKVRLTVRFSGAPRTVTQTIAFTKSTRSNPVRRATVPAPVARKAR